MKGTLHKVIFCHKQIWSSSKLYFTLSYLIALPIGFEGFLWAYGNKLLIDTLTAVTTKTITFAFTLLYPYLLIIGIWLVVNSINQIFTRYIGERLWRRFYANFHIDITTKIDKIDLQTFEDTKFLDTLQNTQDNFKAILDVYLGSVRLSTAVVGATIAIISLSFIHPLIPLTIAFLTILGIFANHIYFIKRQKLDKEMTPTRRLRGQFYSYFFYPASISEMRLYNLQSKFRNRLADLEETMITKYTSLATRFLPFKALTVLLDIGFIQVGTRLYIFALALVGKVTIGQFAFYIGQVGTFTSSLKNIGNNVDNINEALIGLDYYFEFVKVLPVLDYSNATSEVKGEGIEIEFRNVTFAYPGVPDRKILTNFNLTIKKGDKVAIIGLNGAGKTTLLKLALRLYDPDEGEILINEVDIKNIKLEELYKRVGILPQNFMSYELSVRENIGYGNVLEMGNSEKITAALNQASAWDFVKDYPDQLEQVLGRKYASSIQPSVGQWQKIALARTFFRNADLLILDEPTASIDAKSEAEIFEKVETLSQDKTVVIISHRFSTVRKADIINVVENGAIVEKGTHEELMNISGTYAELFTLQAKGYQ